MQNVKPKGRRGDRVSNEGAFLKALSLILFAILMLGVLVSTAIGQQTGNQLALKQYSWPLNEPIVGVFINDGSTSIDLGAAHFYFYPHFELNLTGTCSGATLTPQQSCGFTIALPSSIVAGKIGYTTTSPVTTTWTITYTYGWVTGEPYALMLTIAGVSHYFTVYYGGASNQPQQWAAISPGQQPVVMVSNGVTSNGVYPPTTPSPSQSGGISSHAFNRDLSIIFLIIVCIVWLPVFVLGHSDTDESFILTYSFERTCKGIPSVVTSNRWRLVEANEKLGHFKVKIGMSLTTFEQVMLIDVSQLDASSCKVTVHCRALHQLYNWGKNHSDIAKLHTKLLEELG
jgi:hypothetical protein